jgi:ArsR family transcriptional regulator
MQCEDFAKTFNALGDSTRFKLFQLLGEKPEICVSQLAEAMKITPACVSQHMKILAEAGLVNRVREGQRVCYQVNVDSPSNKVLSNLIFNKVEA